MRNVAVPARSSVEKLVFRSAILKRFPAGLSATYVLTPVSHDFLVDDGVAIGCGGGGGGDGGPDSMSILVEYSVILNFV